MLNDIVNTIGTVVSGRDRYFAATRIGLELEQSYRSYRNQAERLPLLERRRLLAQTHHQGAQKFSKFCHDNGAIWVKFGQFLSTRSDFMPRQYVVELEKLQDAAKPVSFSKIEGVLVREWGPNWRRQFQSIDETPVAAASVAQVHKAVLASGEAVAVKVQLPMARRHFHQDSLMFKALGLFGAGLISQFDVKQVTEQIVDMTMQELDFLKEEANLRKFASLPHLPVVYVPKLYDALSTGRVLVTEWINGMKLTDYLDANPFKGRVLLRRMATSYIQQITEFGVYHADPHPGNFLVMSDDQVAFLDYGAIGELTAEQTQQYGVLLQVFFNRLKSDVPLGELFRNAGFVAEDQSVFEEVAELVLKENLRRNDPVDVLRTTMETMGNLNITIPDSFVTLARVILTFGGLLNTYKVGF